MKNIFNSQTNYNILGISFCEAHVSGVVHMFLINSQGIQ